MKTILKLGAFLITACIAADAQVVPQATASRANLNYALRYSQSGVFQNDNQTSWQMNASAEVDCANGNERFPFTLDYGGGYTRNLAGPSIATGVFQRLLISQGYAARRWNVLASDSVYYLPQSPAIGFSGIPGTGEPIGGSGSIPSSTLPILAVNTRIVNNDAKAEFGVDLNNLTTLSLGGKSQTLRFLDGNGQDTDAPAANARISQRLDARNSLAGEFSYSRFSYGDSTFTLAINTVLIDYHRAWTRHISTDASVGPQWVKDSEKAALPASTRFSASAALNYRFRFGSTNLSYNHQVNSGGGFLLGTMSDSADLGYSHEFGRNFGIGISGGYARHSGLTNNEIISGRVGGVQATWRLNRYVSLFVDYTAIDQSSSSSSPQNNLLNQLEQVFAFGIGYAPRATRHARY